jgi:hypothetical protein
MSFGKDMLFVEISEIQILEFFNRICPKYMMLQDARTSAMRLRAVSGFLKHFQHLFPPPAFENHWHPLGSRQK